MILHYFEKKIYRIKDFELKIDIFKQIIIIILIFSTLEKVIYRIYVVYVKKYYTYIRIHIR